MKMTEQRLDTTTNLIREELHKAYLKRERKEEKKIMKKAKELTEKSEIRKQIEGMTKNKNIDAVCLTNTVIASIA